MIATSGFQWVHIHSIILRALRQRATHNNDMAVEPEEGVKLAHGRLQPTLQVRAKTRRQTITSDGTSGLLCLRNPGRRQTAIFHVRVERDSGMCVARDLYELWGRSPYTRMFVARTSH